MNLPFVIPGLYVKTSTLHLDHKEVIQVLEEARPNSNMWRLANDTRELYETDILNNYTFVSSSNGMDKKGTEVVLGEFTNEPTEESKEIIYEAPETEIKEDTYVYKAPEKSPKTITETKVETKVIEKEKIVYKEHNPDKIFVEKILSNLSADRELNKQGVVEFKTDFSIPIDFKFNHNLTSLAKVLPVLDLTKEQEDMLLDILVSDNMVTDTKTLLKRALKDFLYKGESTFFEKVSESVVEDKKESKISKENTLTETEEANGKPTRKRRPITDFL